MQNIKQNCCICINNCPTRCNTNQSMYYSASSLYIVNKNPTRCYIMQIFIYCKVTLHVSGVTATIIRSTKNCWREVAVPVL